MKGQSETFLAEIWNKSGESVSDSYWISVIYTMGMEMKALFRNRLLLSGRELDFATSKLDLLARGSRRHLDILKNGEFAMG